ncbi:MAG TPA: hypothetical protein PLF21_00275 [Exilispira sp.]|nr:hypothetical protein [Exilispira sp.]
MSNFSFENRLEQKQVLLPSLILEMKLISMNSIELEQYIKEKSEENPFIEYEENYEEIIKYFPKYDNNLISSSDLLDKTDHQYESIFDYFKNELEYYEISEEEKNYALLLIPYLSKNGMLTKKLTDIAKELNLPFHLLENGKICIAAIDTKGYASENLKEMILAQIWLSDNDQSLFLFDALFDNYEDIISKNFNKLIKKGFNKEDIENIVNLMTEIIQIPPPIVHEISNYIVPDAVVTIKEGKISYKIIEPFKFNIYKYQLKESNPEFKKMLNDAKNLNNALILRKSTFETFMKYFVIFQQEFFFKGEKYIKPISQKEFANKIEISESTLSRIVNNKYIDTPFGIYPLKYFFSASYSKKLGKKTSENTQSRLQVINAIKEIIENEPKDNPYSDEEIVEILSKKGYYISRRTCSKYRDIAGIPSKQLRKGVIKKS